MRRSKATEIPPPDFFSVVIERHHNCVVRIRDAPVNMVLIDGRSTRGKSVSTMQVVRRGLEQPDPFFNSIFHRQALEPNLGRFHITTGNENSIAPCNRTTVPDTGQLCRPQRII